MCQGNLGGRDLPRCPWPCACARLLGCVQIFVTPWTVARQARLSMGFSRQQYWSGLSFPLSKDFPNPGIKPAGFVCLFVYHQATWQGLGSPRCPWTLHSLSPLSQSTAFCPKHGQLNCTRVSGRVCVLVTQSSPTLCDHMDCSPPGSSVHEILQARILESVAIPFSRGSSQPRDWTWISCIAGRFFTVWATREACIHV